MMIGQLFPAVAAGGLDQVANFAALPGAPADGDLAQLADSGRVMRYSDVPDLWLPASYVPTTLLDHLDGTAVPSAVGWTDLGGIAPTVAGGAIVLNDNSTGGGMFLKFHRAFASVDAVTSVGMVVDIETTRATTTNSHNLFFGFRFGGKMYALGASKVLGQGSWGLPTATSNITFLACGAGEGPDSSVRRQAYILSDPTEKMIEVGSLEEGPLFRFPHSAGVTDSANFMVADTNFGFSTFSATDSSAKVHNVWAFN